MAFSGLVIASGTAVLFRAFAYPASRNIAEFICYLLIAVLASRLKVSLPEVTDNMSVNYMFVLIGVLDLSFTETVMMGTVGVLVQSFYGQKPRPVRIAFNLCATAFASAMAYDFYHRVSPVYGKVDIRPLLLVLAACIYFFINTGSVATLITLTERKSFRKIWVQHYGWSFPYYLGGAAIAGVIGWLNVSFQWESSLW